MIAVGHLRGLSSGGLNMPAPVLDLNFLLGQPDPRLTYTRASLASRIDSDGRLTIAPHNLCLFSEQFNQAWSRESISAFGAGSLVDTAIAPDGTQTADVIDDGAGSGRHIIFQQRPIPGDGWYTASVFVKDFGRRFVQLLVTTSGLTSGGFIIADLQAGTITQTKAFASAALVAGSQIEPAGNGWFRISFCLRILTGISSLFFIVATSDRSTDASGSMSFSSPSYVGAGLKLALWGAQLELIGQEGRVRAYLRSTAVPFYGPRIDHDPDGGAPRGLLIEEARTNLILRSEAPSSQAIAVLAQPYTISYYGTGSITLSGATSASLSGAGAFPARRVFSFTPAAGTLSLVISGEVRFAQCELGAFATSWIPTWNAVGLRASDDARFDAASLALWLSRASGSFVVEGSRLNTSIRGDFLHLRNVGNAALGELNAFSGASGALDVSIRRTVGSLTASSPGALLSPAVGRAAIAYGTVDGGISINGSSPVSATDLLALSQADAMTIGSNIGPTRFFLNGHVRRIRHYNTRLSNTALRRLSS